MGTVNLILLLAELSVAFFRAPSRCGAVSGGGSLRRPKGGGGGAVSAMPSLLHLSQIRCHRSALQAGKVVPQRHTAGTRQKVAKWPASALGRTTECSRALSCGSDAFFTPLRLRGF